MRNIFLIAKREFLERVRSKVFRVTTVLVPFGVLLVATGGNLVAKKAGGLSHLAIASNNAALATTMKEQLAASSHPPQSVQIVSPATPQARTQLTNELTAGKLDGFLWITGKPGQTRPDATYYTRNGSDLFSQSLLQNNLGRAALRQALISRGISPPEAQSLVKPIKITTLQLKSGQAVKTNVERSYMGIYALVVLLYGVVLIYGTNMARSIADEKSSRIFEVLLSSAPADNLMMGKLLGVGGSALLQVAIWIAITLAFAGTHLAAQIGVNGLSSLGINLAELVYFVVYFVLGFFLYSAFSAALGSTLNSSQEVQQFAFFIASPLIVSVMLMAYVMSHPNSLASTVLSLFPPFTPIIMYLRICSQTPPWWQIGLSIALLAGAIWGMIWIAARIYRIGILMYGKRPTLPEILRWLKYS
jgi:ABC-2 type transport system permease protein